MSRRSRSTQGMPTERTIWSASEHLVVEAPIEPPQRRRTVRRFVSVVVLIACAAALVVLLLSPPAPELVATGRARTPTGWLERYAHRLHRHLELVTTTQYHGSLAYLDVTDGRHQTVITLYKQAGFWEAAQEQHTHRSPAS